MLLRGSFCDTLYHFFKRILSSGSSFNSSHDVIEKRFEERLVNVVTMCERRGTDYKQNWENLKNSGKTTVAYVAYCTS